MAGCETMYIVWGEVVRRATQISIMLTARPATSEEVLAVFLICSKYMLE